MLALTVVPALDSAAVKHHRPADEEPQPTVRTVELIAWAASSAALRRRRSTTVSEPRSGMRPLRSACAGHSKGAMHVPRPGGGWSAFGNRLGLLIADFRGAVGLAQTVGAEGQFPTAASGNDAERARLACSAVRGRDRRHAGSSAADRYDAPHEGLLRREAPLLLLLVYGGAFAYADSSAGRPGLRRPSGGSSSASGTPSIARCAIGRLDRRLESRLVGRVSGIPVLPRRASRSWAPPSGPSSCGAPSIETV